MPAKASQSLTLRTLTASVRRLHAEVALLRTELEAVRRESQMHLRRCAELQAELDTLKKPALG